MKLFEMTSELKLELVSYKMTTLSGDLKFSNCFFLGIMTRIGSFDPFEEAQNAAEILTSSAPAVEAFTLLAPFFS